MFKNETGIGLPIAVWLASSGDYDLVSEPNVISATSLQRPLKSLILSKRMVLEQEMDIDEIIPAKLGSSVHYSVEIAWKNNYISALEALGHPMSMIHRIAINPEQKSQYPSDTIFVHIEQRKAKEIDGYIISGKYDMVIDGELHDIKTTKTYSYITGSNEGDYRLQGSIYRWLNPDIITGDFVHINYLFTDWTPTRAVADPDYPKSRCITKPISLYSIEETEAYIKKRIADLKYYEGKDQEELPQCTMKDLWQELPKYALYKDPNKTQRATKLFDLENDAMIYNATKCGGKGLIIKREGQVKRCIYCEARSICTQAEELEARGLLK
jgi:hypothetical protein